MNLQVLTPLTLLAAAALLTGCSTAPKPPQADESARRPANDAAYIEMLRLRAEAARAREELSLQRRAAASQRMLAEAQAVRQPEAMRGGGIPVYDLSAVPKGANFVYTARFPLGATKLALPSGALNAVAAAASQAPLVVVRGRTDATRDNPTDARIARLRAESARVALVRAGVRAESIRVMWQGAGDTVASNDTPEGRALNRRVEIEVYGAAPNAASLEPPASATLAAK